jgi:transcriptional regulator GlxA family with amidase domain
MLEFAASRSYGDRQPRVEGNVAYDRSKVLLNVDKSLCSNPWTTLSALALQLGVERHTIERIVRQSYGVSFRSYRTGQVLMLSLNLLLDQTCLSVKEIANRLGFGSASSFSRFIKYHTNLPPTSIRTRYNDVIRSPVSLDTTRLLRARRLSPDSDHSAPFPDV